VGTCASISVFVNALLTAHTVGHDSSAVIASSSTPRAMVPATMQCAYHVGRRSGQTGVAGVAAAAHTALRRGVGGMSVASKRSFAAEGLDGLSDRSRAAVNENSTRIAGERWGLRKVTIDTENAPLRSVVV